MRETRGKQVALAVALIAGIAGAAGANTATAFPPGSLIIPTGAAFQDDCGAVSTYGLVYDVLRANPWLGSNGYTPITVFYDYLDTKQSPNRCVPTSLDSAPSTGAAATWSDGCDIVNVTATLISNTSSTAADTNIVTFNNSSKTNVYPRYGKQTVTSTTTVNYLGGPFIVLASDAGTFQKLLAGEILANDVNGNQIDFTPFRTKNSGETTAGTSACTFGTDHYVNVHRATTTFVANIGKAFSAVPPRLALLATDTSSTKETSNITDGILESYLQNAGLDYSGAAGCPPNGKNVSSHTYCPSGNTRGQIYDAFDIDDLATGKLASTDGSGSGIYTMLWTPHWETKSTLSTKETSAFTNIGTFLNGQTGLAAECESISSYEGDHGDNGHSTFTAGLPLQTSSKVSSNANPSCAGGGGCSPYKDCSDPTTSSGTACVYYSYPGDSFVQTADYLWTPVNGETFSYLSHSGSYGSGVLPLISVVSSNSTSLADATVTPYNNSGTLSTSAQNARAMVADDFVTRSVKDNTPGKANILYLAGHDQSNGVAGTKLMMETLLQLGLSTLPDVNVSVEVSRSNPIDATVAGSDSIVQGTIELVTPTPTAITYSANGQGSAFVFPQTHGHLRARLASTIITTGSSFSSGTIFFDAASGIPSANYSGCSTHFTATCRTVFTTIAAGRNPAMHFLEQGEISTLGPLMGTNTAGTVDLDAGNQATLMEAVLGGSSPVLGGVDHSTVAVIGTSDVVSGTRPTMAYVGATDGMLHAICASTGGACDAIGRELWAYLPRTSLEQVRYNSGRIDGSPRVLDAYGDFYNTGEKSWRTILMFQTGFGDTSSSVRLPAVYALDISDPSNPAVLWEYSLSNPSSRNNAELGLGLTLAAGEIKTNNGGEWMAYAETNNAGTGSAGTVLTAIDLTDGSASWQTFYPYNNPHRTSGSNDMTAIAAGLPGGAVGVDKTGQGFITDVVFGTLYGDLWDVDPTTGISVDSTGVTGSATPPGKPLFSFSSDYHAIGTPPAIYTNGGTQYAVITSGGYVEQYPNDTPVWQPGSGGVSQYALAISLNTPKTDATINQSKGSPDIAFTISFGTGEASYAQATVIGNQVFITTDTADINNESAYGLTGATGHVYSYNFASASQGSTVVVEGGASSIINAGVNLYAGASNLTQQLASTTLACTPPCGSTVDQIQASLVKRTLWLRVQ